MGRKREIPPAPKRVRFAVKAREDVEPALFERLKELEQSYERGRRSRFYTPLTTCFAIICPSTHLSAGCAKPMRNALWRGIATRLSI